MLAVYGKKVMATTFNNNTTTSSTGIKLGLKCSTSEPLTYFVHQQNNNKNNYITRPL